MRWDENGTSVSESAVYSFIATTPRVLTAIFEPDTLSATFDFDSGLPALIDGDGLPTLQTSGGWSAAFSAAFGDFSVQSDASLGWNLTRMGGHYLLPVMSPSVLDVIFDRPVSSVSISFGTLDYQSNAPPSEAQLSAWSDSAGTQWIGAVTAAGVIKPGDTVPTGTLTLVASSIRRIRVEVPAQPSGTTDMVVDDISVRAVPNLLISYQPSDPALVMLRWPAPCSGYVLQTATDPEAAMWQPVNEPMQIVDGQCRVSTPMTANSGFYRLFHP